MNDRDGKNPQKQGASLGEVVGRKAARKLRARHDSASSVWFGLGIMGLVGWSVAIPTLLGAALGHWLDRHHPVAHSWTLALLVSGLAIGCINAWHWVSREEKAMHDREEDRDE
jgi:ATP synthase protein I